MLLFGLSSFEAWIVLIVCSLLPAVVMYRILGNVVQKNFATLKGTLAGFAVELGGPVAFYILLLLLGKVYIPPYSEITLEGTVSNVNDNSLMEYRIASVVLTSAKEKFTIRAPQNDQSTYSFLITKSGMLYWRDSIAIDDPKHIMIKGFPDEKVTKIIGENLEDQEGNPLPDGYSVEIAPIVRPVSAQVQEGKVNMDIEHGKYKATFCNSQKERCAEDILTDVSQGSRYPLPHPLNIKVKD
jgi:hypothetical protein